MKDEAHNTYEPITNQGKYYSFLIRLWQTQQNDDTTWYVSLENPITRKIQVFQDFDAFYKYLIKFTENNKISQKKKMMEEK